MQTHKLNFAEEFFENKKLKKISPTNIFCIKNFPKTSYKFFSKKIFFKKIAKNNF